MTPSGFIDESIKKAQASPHSFNPAEFLNEVQNRLSDACRAGGLWDAIEPNMEAQAAYFRASDFLSESGYAWAAIQLLEGWWNDIGTRQLTESKHIYRANSAYKLTQLHIKRQDRGAALRWALLTQADDLLHQHGEGGGAGRQWLRTTLDMNQYELEMLAQIAADAIATHAENPLLRTALFAEQIVVRLALQDIAYSHLFSQPTLSDEFSLTNAYLTVLLEGMDQPQKSSTAKGSALEDLASYLILLIPGWIPQRNLLDISQGFENDVVVSNLNKSSNLTAELMGRHFLVECKNREKAINVSEVGYFLHRMYLTHCSFGVMMAKEGITGKEMGETAAHAIIRRTYHEDGRTCVVIDRSDLASLARGDIGFWPLLLQKMQEFRFGKPR